MKETRSSSELVSLGFDDSNRLTEAHKGWVEEVLEGDGYIRDAKWPESIAVGSKSFVEKVEEKLGIRAIGSGIVGTEAGCELKGHFCLFTDAILTPKWAF